MKHLLRLGILTLIISGFLSGDNAYRNLRNESFSPGEFLEYRVHLGFINAGFATLHISEDIYIINDRPCFKADIIGESAGILDIFYNVRDNWGSYIDTASIVPHRAYRYIAENRYRKNEIVNFEHSTDTAIVSKLDKKTRELKRKVYYPIPKNVQDIVSGYYYLRTIDFNRMTVGDTLTVAAFFDEEVYHLNIIYLGKDEVKTKFGRINAFVLSPIMPTNKLFRGNHPIKVWFSNDKNKVPLKIKAAMFVGSVEVDLKSHKNLRNPFSFVD